jgi:hypothetical protein
MQGIADWLGSSQSWWFWLILALMVICGGLCNWFSTNKTPDKFDITGKKL